MNYTNINLVKKAIFNRPNDANKGTCGSLLSICGCYGMSGAAVLAGRAALRSGIGLLKTALPHSIYPIASTNMLESVFYPLKETDEGKISRENIPYLIEQAENSSAVLIGCGLSVCDDTRFVVREIIQNCSKPLLLDADALNCIADNPSILLRAKNVPIITPHPGEMSRLTKLSTKEINSDRENIALSFARKYNTVCVLKGAGTVIASPNGEVLVNPTGNSGMATGGSGDVLSGIAGALLAQGAEPFYAAAAAVYIHGLAGDMAAERLGKISMLPSDIIEFFPNAFRKVII